LGETIELALSRKFRGFPKKLISNSSVDDSNKCLANWIEN
jgi:hypothetical protein